MWVRMKMVWYSFLRALKTGTLRLPETAHSDHTHARKQRGRMQHNILLHLPRDAADFNAERVSAVLKPAMDRLGFKLERIPTHDVPSAIPDLKSDEVLCAVSRTGIPADKLRCLQWAVHKRHSKDVASVRRQLLCDLNNGDESRVKRKPRREKSHGRP